MKATFEDLPVGRWNEAQVNEAMRRVAIDAAAEWAATLLLQVEECFASDASAETQDWGIAVAGAAMLNLIEQSETVAVILGLSPDKTRTFIADRAGAFRSRLDELVNAFGTRGHA